MFRALLYIFLIYLAYQFIFNFLIPLYKTTQQVKKGFREMSARMNRSDGHDRMTDSANGNPQSASRQTQSSVSSDNKNAGDYIDFEEIK